jgi:GWxTD domain-containing protein
MNRRGIVTALLTFFLFSSLVVVAQQKDSKKSKQSKQEDAEKAKSRQIELQNKALKKWLDEDVAYIITDEERAAFKRLTTDEEREQFIEQFWLRRDPSPDTIENEFKEEHYERIAYANERFSSGKPGWKTDRGRIYITRGKPDEIESHPSGGTYDRPFEEGGGTTTTYPFEIWRYRYIEGMGNNVTLEFVDKSLTGEYRLTIDPNEKDALLYVPGAGLTMDEEMNGTDKSNRISGIQDSSNPSSQYFRNNQFDRLDMYAKIFKPPEIKFKDLEAVVTTNISYNILPFNMRMDFVRVTEETVLTPISLQIAYKDLAFKQDEGIHKAVAHVLGIVTGVNGRRVQTFEDTFDKAFPDAEFQRALDFSAVYQKTVPLRPGLYKIDLVIKDINSGNVGVVTKSFSVPRIPDQKLATSSLIIADLIEPLPPRQIATGQFVLGGDKVRPNVKEEFKRDQNLNYWLQVYSLKVDEATHKPSATVETLITRGGKEVKRIVENASDISGAAQQMTLTKSMPLKDFEPGDYTIQVKVTDNLTKDVVASPGKTTFKVQ